MPSETKLVQRLYGPARYALDRPGGEAEAKGRETVGDDLRGRHLWLTRRWMMYLAR